MSKYEIRSLAAADLHALQTFTPEAWIWRTVTPEKFALIAEQPAFSGLVDGKLIGCGGIINIWPGLAEAWLALTPFAKAHVSFLYRQSLRFLPWARSTYTLRRIQTTVQADWVEALRFIERLGFVRVALLEQYGPNGEAHFLYEMVK